MNKKLSYLRDSAGRRLLRRSRSFKVSDFGANTIQFPLMISGTKTNVTTSSDPLTTLSWTVSCRAAMKWQGTWMSCSVFRGSMQMCPARTCDALPGNLKRYSADVADDSVNELNYQTIHAVNLGYVALSPLDLLNSLVVFTL